MAFVYRADRKINIQDKEPNSTYPGEYFNNTSLVKDIDKQSSEFQSNSIRNIYAIKKNNDTPGPGSYESDIIKYNGPHYHKRAKSKDIYEAVKNNLMSKEILKFLEKNQNIAFNTRAQRFTYMVEDLEKKKKLPGPGSYSPNGSSININTDCSTVLNLNNSSKRSYDISKNFPTTHSNYRSETIPSKGNLGYEYDKQGIKKMIKNPNFSVNSDKNESLLGPGYYNIIDKKKDNGISWSKTRDEKNPKYNLIKYKKNLKPLTELEQDYLENKNNLDNKSKTMSNIKKPKEKNPIFSYIMNRRYNMIKNMKNKIDAEKELIFETTPGPGYYAPDNDKIFYETQNVKNSNKCFQSTSPRFKTKTLNNLDTKIGPGYYFEKTKPTKIKKDKLTKGHLINVNKKDIQNSAFNISMIKEDFKIPGPGYYEIFGSQFPKAISTNNNFGFNGERFKALNDELTNSPGPGYYNWCKDQFTRTARSLPKNNYINNKQLFTNSKSDLINVKEMNKYTKDKFFVPPIGLYNPYIITSIAYNNRAKINTFTDKTVVGFGSQEKKGNSFISKDNNKLVGPGIYYKNPNKTTKQNNAPFNQNKKRFDYNEKNINPGPGSYELNSYEEWNKKSHNILFV